MLNFEFIQNVTPLICVYRTDEGYITEYADRIDSIKKGESNWDDYKKAVKSTIEESIKEFENLYAEGLLA